MLPPWNPQDEPLMAGCGAYSTTPGSAATNAFDGNSATVWESAIHPNANAEEWISFWFSGFTNLNYVRLTPNYNANNQALGFPVSLDIYYVGIGTTNWVVQKTVSGIRRPSGGDVIISFPPVNCNGILIMATALGDDMAGNYYFALVEARAGYSPLHSQEEPPLASYGSFSTTPGSSVTNAFDGNTSTVWTSAIHPSANAEEWITFSFGGFTNINYVRLTPRYNANNQALGFPGTLNIDYAAYGTDWQIARTITGITRPSGGEIIYSFAPVSCYGVLIDASILGDDMDGNYFFSLAELRAGYSPDY
jgi:hypothetical protein